MATPAVEASRSFEERRYFERVAVAYREVTPLGFQSEDSRGTDLVEFMVQLFNYQIDYKLGDKLDKQRLGQVLDFLVSAERSRMQLETEFAERNMRVSEFVATSDLQAISFQKDAARVLKPHEYEALFDLKHGEFVALADPEIVASAFRQLEL